MGIDDDSFLSQLETNEFENPSARKVADVRTIYESQDIPLTRGEPIISDLGEARHAESKQSGLIQPSVYRAPEVILGMEWDNMVDIWALGQTVCSIARLILTTLLSPFLR